VFGNVGNGAGGLCAVTGNGVVTFYNNFVNDGEVRVHTGSTAVFMGTFSGSHGTTGGGTVIIEGDLSGGHSPAAVAFEGDIEFGPGADLVIELAGLASGAQYDQVIVGGNLVADGTLNVRLLDGFMPGVGNEFDVLEFAAIDGTFDAVNLPGLAPGLRWDTSSLYSDGVLTVVPEPATLSLLALGGLGALLRRRRKTTTGRTTNFKAG